MYNTIIKELEALKAENKKLKLENYELEKRKKYGLVWEDKPEIFEEHSHWQDFNAKKRWRCWQSHCEYVAI